MSTSWSGAAATVGLLTVLDERPRGLPAERDRTHAQNATTTTAPETGGPLPLRTPSAKAPLRLWIGGDSLAAGPSWATFEAAQATGVVKPLAEYQVGTGIVRDDSRLNQVLLVRLDPGVLDAQTRARAAEGIVAYSAVCTHTGCDAWDWQAASGTVKCPCHFSEFDLKAGARVLNGPAQRRLPSLPLKIADGAPVVAAGFVGRPGFESGGA